MRLECRELFLVILFSVFRQSLQIIVYTPDVISCAFHVLIAGVNEFPSLHSVYDLASLKSLHILSEFVKS